jgi:hypothetical protein
MRIGVCPACGHIEGLVCHHWYDKNGVYQTKYICATCNGHLKTGYGVGKNHRLPDWETQKVMIDSVYGTLFYSANRRGHEVPEDLLGKVIDQNDDLLLENRKLQKENMALKRANINLFNANKELYAQHDR